MNFSTFKRSYELDVEGVEYELGSVYDRLCRLTDIRKAKGKRYRLETILILIVAAKLCGADRPMEIAEWGKNHQDQLVKLLKLPKARLPHYNTYRRIMAQVVYEEEIARLVGEYNQAGEHGDVYAMDGKAPRGTRKKDEDGLEYLLSVCDVTHMKVLSQVAVGRKENEITKAPKALENVKIKGKIITGDAMHTQRGLSAIITDQGGCSRLPRKRRGTRLVVPK